MSEQVLRFLEQSSAVISLFAVLIILVGFALAAGRYARRYRDTPLKENFAPSRSSLAAR